MEQRGTLKSWNDEKGFGFITPEAGGPDVFAHISAMRGDSRPSAGDRVLYVDGRDAQGRLRAEHIRRDGPMTLDRPAIRRRPAVSGQTAPSAGKVKTSSASRSRSPVSGSISQLQAKLWLWLGLCALPLWGGLQVLLEQNSLLPLVVYLLASLLAFALYWSDKQSAQKGRWRTPENTLHLCELAGGWPGALLAQQVFRHKTRKVSYQALFWLIVLLHQIFWVDYLFLGKIISGDLLQRILG